MSERAVTPSLPVANGDVVDSALDPREGSGVGTDLEFSDANRSVRSTSNAFTLAVLDRGFGEEELTSAAAAAAAAAAPALGRITWEFKLVKDSQGGECTCFGVVTKPAIIKTYSNPNAWMYRAYNGRRYGSGAVDGYKAKIHKDDVVRMELDLSEGTLTYFVNGISQGVCFKGLRGKPFFPAVCFYANDRKVTLLRVDSTGVAVSDKG